MHELMIGVKNEYMVRVVAKINMMYKDK